MRRKIACPTFAHMCVATQLDYLDTKTCTGLKPRETQIRALDTEIRTLWTQRKATYFEQNWLRNSFHFTEKRSASFDIDPKTPVAAFQWAMANLGFQNPETTWDDPNKSFYGILIVENKHQDLSHAIAIRKSHSQLYFIHDIHTESKSKTALDNCDCREYRYADKDAFETGLDASLKRYHHHGYTTLFVIALIKEKPYCVFTGTLRNRFFTRQT